MKTLSAVAAAAVATLALSIAITSNATAQGGLVYYVDSGGVPEEEPGALFVPGGFGGPCLRSLDWGNSWGTEHAVAKGNYKHSCAGAVVFKAKAKVEMSRIITCTVKGGFANGQTLDIYKRATYTYRHDGEKVTKKFSAGRSECE